VIVIKRKKKDAKGIYCPKCNRRLFKDFSINVDCAIVVCPCGYAMKKKDMVLK
jgi:hypothetical protein